MHHKRGNKKDRTYKDLLKLLNYKPDDEEKVLWEWFDEQKWNKNKRNKEILKDYFSSSMPLREIGEKYDVSRERVRQIIAKMLKYLRHPRHRQSLFNRLTRTGYWGDKIYILLNEISMKLDRVGFAKDRWIALGELFARPIDYSEWSMSTLHAFHDPRFKKIETLKDLVRETKDSLLKRKNFGKVSLREVKKKLKVLGLQLGMDV